MKKHPIFLIVATVILFWGWLAALMFGAEISGPESVQIGQLARFESDVEGDWVILPARGVGLAKDSGRRAAYAAITRGGDYTLVFFGIENGQAVITQKALTVVDGDAPHPQLNTTLTAAEKTALSAAASAVVRGIANGIVKQPNHARMEFKRIATVNLGGAVSDGVQAFLAEWSETHKIRALDELKATFEALAEELK